MRYQVPQFVDIEDKIIGPFTLKQFLIYFCGVLLLIPVYLLSDLSLFITLAIPVGGIAVLFAHFKPNGKPLSRFVANAIGFFTGGQLYLWRREPGRKLLSVPVAEFEDALLQQYVAEQEQRSSSLENALRTIETEGNVSKEDEEDPLDVTDQTSPNGSQNSQTVTKQTGSETKPNPDS